MSEAVETDSEWTKEMEQHQQGYEAGEVFVKRHIIEKINLFLKTYREKKWDTDFIRGWMDGISDNTGISFKVAGQTEESDESALQDEEDVVE